MLASKQTGLATAGTKWVPVIALLFALVAGVFAWQQRQQARDLTTQIASLTAELQQKNAAMQEREASIDRLRQENDTYIKESASLREKETTSASAPPSTAPTPSLSSADKNRVEFAAKTLDDPRGKELMRQKQSAAFRQIYGDFVKESNLNAEQAEQFYSLLLDEDMRQFDEDTDFFSGNGADADSRDAQAKEWARRKTELDKQLKALLGETGFAKWETYEKTTGERQVLVHMREQLALNSTPLRQDQAEPLLRILMEERARAPSTLLDPGAREDPREQYRKLLEDNNADQYYREEKDFHQRVLSRASSLVDAEQYEALETFQNQYLEVAKAGIEMLRATMTSKKK
jgi:hypothetical protein